MCSLGCPAISPRTFCHIRVEARAHCCPWHFEEAAPNKRPDSDHEWGARDSDLRFQDSILTRGRFDRVCQRVPVWLGCQQQTCMLSRWAHVATAAPAWVYRLLMARPCVSGCLRKASIPKKASEALTAVLGGVYKLQHRVQTSARRAACAARASAVAACSRSRPTAGSGALTAASRTWRQKPSNCPRRRQQ